MCTPSGRGRPEEAAAGLRELAERLRGGETAALGGDAGAADALAGLDPARDRIVSYVGKLIVSKGVDLLLAAWPLVVARVPEARLVVVGFGTYRDALRDDFVGALAARGRGRARASSPRVGGSWRAGRPGRSGTFRPSSARVGDEWRSAAPGAAERIHFTGRLEHDDLPDLLPACEAQVMPSTFPEAFGMVAAEAAACGALPLSADHSGMAEVTATLAPSLPEQPAPASVLRGGPELGGGHRREAGATG